MTDIETGEVFAEGEYEAAADSATEIDYFKVCQADKRMLLIEWENNGEVSYNHYLLGSAPFDLGRYLGWLKTLDEKIYTAFGRHEW